MERRGVKRRKKAEVIRPVFGRPTASCAPLEPEKKRSLVLTRGEILDLVVREGRDRLAVRGAARSRVQIRDLNKLRDEDAAVLVSFEDLPNVIKFPAWRKR